MNILILEQDQGLVDVYKIILSKHNCVTSEGTTKPHCVIIDHLNWGPDTEELLNYYAQNNIPIVLTTCWTLSQPFIDKFKLNHILIKPFSIEAFENIFQSINDTVV